MKPYETGICVHCGKKKDKHIGTADYCYPADFNSTDETFLDSGTAHLCSEEVASGMLNALKKIAALYKVGDEAWAVIASEAINEALKR